jgi:hypothetical protein
MKGAIAELWAKIMILPPELPLPEELEELRGDPSLVRSPFTTTATPP